MTSVTANLLKTIIADQKDEQVFPSPYFHRISESKLLTLTSNKEIIVLTGLRRCGKSVLLHFIRNQSAEKDFYFNFEDERLASFTQQDFQLLHEILIELYGEQKTFYFDEIQNIDGWEMFVRRLYNAGNKIYITGSNATLFSEELGTRLTGRYIELKIYPFSYYEYVNQLEPEFISAKAISTKMQGKIKQLFQSYCVVGGIPEYTKLQQPEYLHSLYESILYRDIVARYKISLVTTMRQLVVYLASHCGKEVTFNSLKKLLGLGSPTTVSEYCAYLENSHLCYFISRYDDSLKAQQQSPKKTYFVDHALAKLIGFRISEDKGRLLENMVFMELKRRGHEIFYHRANKECDFIIRTGIKITEAIQVCFDLSHTKTKEREINGLVEAMEIGQLKTGKILTESEESVETIEKEGQEYTIHIMPVWRWLLSA